jgi:hypothetical protein
MKKFQIVVGVLVLWAAGAYWATNWIDKRNFDDFPGRVELAAARLLWSWSPAIHRDKDAERALKFSWLRAKTEIYQEKVSIPRITNTLNEESAFLGAYLAAHKKSISIETLYSVMIQTLTYLNRRSVFVTLSDSDVNSIVQREAIVGQHISSFSLEMQENWYREMMILGKLHGKDALYEENRNALLRTVNQYGNLPSTFIEGAMDFYDGVLLCAIGKTEEALPYIEAATKQLAKTPKYATHLWSADLNAALIGKGIAAGAKCEESINKMVLSGE